jgi:hypothetical protein
MVMFYKIAPDKTIPNTVLIYRHIFTLEKEGTTQNDHGIFITEASGFVLLAEVCLCLYFYIFYCVIIIR